jgi:hypothetical protein
LVKTKSDKSQTPNKSRKEEGTMKSKRNKKVGKVTEDFRRKSMTFLAILFMPFVFCGLVCADSFLITKYVDLRSGPGKNYEVAGHAKKGDMKDIADDQWKSEGEWFCNVQTVTFTRNKKFVKRGWTVFMSSEEWDQNKARNTYAVGKLADFLVLKKGKIQDYFRRGIVIRVTGEEMRRGDKVSKGVMYHPVTEKRCIHKSFGRIIEGVHYCILGKVKAVKRKGGLPKATKDCTMTGKLVAGMTTDQIQAMWGHPPINRTIRTFGWGSKEQWVYGKQSLFFEKGKLVSWTKRT